MSKNLIVILLLFLGSSYVRAVEVSAPAAPAQVPETASVATPTTAASGTATVAPVTVQAPSTSTATTPVTPTPAPYVVPWTSWARKVFGESEEVFQESKKNLESLKNLDEILRRNIESGPSRDLALDVVGALNRKSVLEFLFTHSENDKDGREYLTIAALLTKSNEKKIFDLFADRLLSGGASEAARIVMIDVLGRGKYNFSFEHLKDWLEKGSPDLGQSILVYLKRLKSSYSSAQMKEITTVALKSKFFQLRMMTVFEFPYYLLDLSICTKDSNEEIRKLCEAKQKSKEVDW